MYDHFSDAVSISAQEAWAGRVPDVGARVHDRGYVAEMLRRFHESSEYIDCHVWVVTPREFVQQLAELAERGLLDFVVDDILPTEVGDLEFFVTLRRVPRTTPPADVAALFERASAWPADEGPAEPGPPRVAIRLLSEREARLVDAKRRLFEATRARLARWRRVPRPPS